MTRCTCTPVPVFVGHAEMQGEARTALTMFGVGVIGGEPRAPDG